MAEDMSDGARLLPSDGPPGEVTDESLFYRVFSAARDDHPMTLYATLADQAPPQRVSTEQALFKRIFFGYNLYLSFLDRKSE